MLWQVSGVARNNLDEASQRGGLYKVDSETRKEEEYKYKELMGRPRPLLSFYCLFHSGARVREDMRTANMRATHMNGDIEVDVDEYY